MSQTDKEPVRSGEAGEAELRAELDECRRELAALREHATELDADRARLETVLAGLPVGVIVAGPKGEILTANEAAKALLGGEVTGTARGPEGGYALYHPDGGPFPPDQLPLPRALERGETSRDVEILVRGARERTVLASGAPVYWPEGEIRGAVVVMQDITDRKRAEEGLVQAASEMGRQRRLLLTVFEHAPVGIAIVDGADLRGKSANPAYLEFLEKPYRTGGIEGVPIQEFIPGAEESGLPALFRKVARTGVAYYDPEYEHVGFPRGVTYWRYSLIPLPAAAGEPADVTIVAIEVTEQVRARREAEALAEGLQGAYEQLARQNELLQRLFDHIPVLLVMWDPRLERFTLNPCAEEVLGWTTEDANEGDFMSKVYPDADYRDEVAAYMQSLQPGWHEWKVTTKDGRQVPSDWANIRLSDDTSIGIGVDLRERKRAEEALREAHAQLQVQAEELQVANEELQAQREELEVANEELQAQREELEVANEELRVQTDELQSANRQLQESRERLTRAQEIARLGSWELDLVHNHLTWSDEVYRIFGLQPQEFAATYEAFLDYIHPDDRAAVDAAYTGSLREGRDSYEIEHRVVRRATGEVRVVHEKCQHFRDETGRIVRSVGMVHDITERKRAEDALAQALQAEREAREEAQEANQAKDQFVALVSHELRNPLNAITAGLHLLRATCPTEGRAGRTLEIVVRNANLQARLVNDLLDLSRLQRGKLQLQRAPVELAKVVAAACQAYDAEAAEAGLTLTCDAETGLWVHGDFDRLQQVVMNLLSNAVKFTPAGGKIRVGVWEYGGMGVAGAGAGENAPARDESGTPTPPHAHTPTRVARVAVEDTGIGIDRELLPHLFSMFRQGEVAGKQKPGLGLGLALVEGIVERHGGRVWAESEGIGKGSRFIVELPLVAGPTLSPSPRRSLSPSQIRVLIVEDNPDTRTVLADTLTLSGYDVSTAGSGEEALEVLNEARPDIMVVDIGLPGINGLEFLRQARELPGMADVPAFAVTGFGAEEDVLRGREAGFAGHFVKPVNVATLLERIREWTGTGEDERVNG